MPHSCRQREALRLVEELRKDRDAIRRMLEDEASQPPALAEVKAALPPGVELLSYQPKRAPFAVAPVSVVTNAGKFYRAYLKDLSWRIEHPEGYATPPLADILAKLADAGLELQVERPGAFINAHAGGVSEMSCPFKSRE